MISAGQSKRKAERAGHLKRIVTDASGASVCACCGMVVEEKPVYRGPPASTKGLAPTKHTRSDHGLGALTDRVVVDKHVFEGENKNDIKWFLAARDICDTHQVPRPVYEEVCHLMRRALALRAFDYRNRDEMIAALIHLSFEIRGRRMPIGIFMSRFRSVTSKRRLYRNTMEMRGLFGMDPLQGKTIALDYLRRYGQNVCRNRAIMSEAEGIVKKAYASGNTAGRNPAGVAAAALHIAAADRLVHIPFRELGRVVGITSVSIRNTVGAVFKRDPYYGSEKAK